MLSRKLTWRVTILVESVDPSTISGCDNHRPASAIGGPLFRVGNRDPQVQKIDIANGPVDVAVAQHQFDAFDRSRSRDGERNQHIPCRPTRHEDSSTPARVSRKTTSRDRDPKRD